MATRYEKMTPEQKQKANARKEAWRKKNRDKVLEYKRKHYRDNIEKYTLIERDRQYRIRYGITLQDYNSMLREQGGRCAICDSEKAGNAGQHFAVDHDHRTGEVRGLLCIKCNARLGWMEVHGQRAVAYLENRKRGTA